MSLRKRNSKWLFPCSSFLFCTRFLNSFLCFDAFHFHYFQIIVLIHPGFSRWFSFPPVSVLLAGSDWLLLDVSDIIPQISPSDCPYALCLSFIQNHRITYKCTTVSLDPVFASFHSSPDNTFYFVSSQF